MKSVEKVIEIRGEFFFRSRAGEPFLKDIDNEYDMLILKLETNSISFKLYFDP